MTINILLPRLKLTKEIIIVKALRRLNMGSKITKDEINGSALYLFKKVHVIIGTIILLLTQLGMVFGAYYGIKEDVRSNLEAISVHSENKDIHMGYADKVHEFVPRGEYRDLKDQITKLEAKIDLLLRESK